MLTIFRVLYKGEPVRLIMDGIPGDLVFSWRADADKWVEWNAWIYRQATTDYEVQISECPTPRCTYPGCGSTLQVGEDRCREHAYV